MIDAATFIERTLVDPETGAFRRRFDVAARIDQLDRIGERYRRDRRASGRRGIDRAGYQRGRDEWTRRVMDEDDFGFMRNQCFKSCMHRCLACRAARCGRRMLQTLHGGIEYRNIVGI